MQLFKPFQFLGNGRTATYAYFNNLRLNGRQFANDILKCIFFKENCILL